MSGRGKKETRCERSKDGEREKMAEEGEKVGAEGGERFGWSEEWRQVWREESWERGDKLRHAVRGEELEGKREKEERTGWDQGGRMREEGMKDGKIAACKRDNEVPMSWGQKA